MKNKKIFLAILFIIGVSLLFGKKAFAGPLTSGQCTEAGGTCEWGSCDAGAGYEEIGNCNLSACCKLIPGGANGGTVTPGTSGLPNGTGATGGTVTPGTGEIPNPNTGGGPTGGTVTPGTSGLPTTPTPTTTPNSTPNPAADYTGALVPCGLNGKADCTLCHLVSGFKNIYDYLLVLLLSATTLIIVVAGVIYIVSSGSKGMIERAKSALIYALTAMILGLLAWLIINTTLNALGYNKSGSWWKFSCDTTQSTGPGTPGPGGTTLPPTQPPAPGTPGNCGGMQTSVQNQCVLASADLQSLLKCLSDNGAPGTVNSVTSQGVGGNLAASAACCGNSNGTSCPHADGTCHHGCGMPQQGYSYAADVATNGWSDDKLCQLAAVAKQCGSGQIWGYKNMDCGGGAGFRYQDGHATHLHISTGSCGH